MQYWRLLAMPGLPFMSRFQLAWAILMFLGVPAWTATIALLPLKLTDGEDPAGFPAAIAIALFLVFQAMSLTPKIAGLLDIVLAGDTRRYGGAKRFAAAAGLEVVFAYLLGAIVTLRTGMFMVGLAFGRSITWGGQARDVAGLSWRSALAELWPQTLFGAAMVATLAALSPAVLAWSLPLIAGYALAVPFAVLTAHPIVGAAFARRGLAGVPEDFDMPAEIRRVVDPNAVPLPVPAGPRIPVSAIVNVPLRD